MKNKSGMNSFEIDVMNALVEAWSNYANLMKQHPEDSHPDDAARFCDGIHACQERLAARVLRRDYPEYWGGRKSTPAIFLQHNED